MILETVVGHTRGCVGSGVCHEATTPRAGARKEARQRQAHEQACHRVRSGLTHQVNGIEGTKSCIHAAFVRMMSGQLRFLGSSSSQTPGTDRLPSSRQTAAPKLGADPSGDGTGTY